MPDELSLFPLLIEVINSKILLTVLFYSLLAQNSLHACKNMRITLTSFPPEIFGEIFNGAARCHLVLEMWKCGDRALISKLAIGVTNIALKSRSRKLPFSCPKLIYQLHSLRFLCVSVSDSAKEHRLDLHSLPKTLERLEIDSANGHTSFFNYAPNSTIEDPQYIETDYPRGRSRLIDLNALFPRLLTLKMTPSLLTQANPPFADTDFAALPASLTCLKVCEIASTGHLMRCLPHALQRIEGSVHWTSDAESALDWQSAPSTLEYIRYLHSPLRSQPTPGLRHVPKSLTCESLPLSEWNQTIASAAPDNLRYLSLRSFDRTSFPNANWMPSLPKGLEALESRVVIDLRVLPRSMKTLSAYQKDEDFDWSPVQAAFSEKQLETFWPPGLTNISIQSFTNLSNIKLLPHTLTFMQLSLSLPGVEGQKVEVNGNDLPPLLTDMGLHPPRICASFGITGSLPPTLTHVMFAGSQCVLENETLSKLPTSVTSLTVNLTLDLTYESVPLYFGAQLTEIDIDKWPLSWFGALPRNLTMLRVNDVDLTPLKIHSTGNAFEALPASLECLQLYSELNLEGIVWSSQCFEHLHNLVVLFAGKGLPAFESGVIRSLSRKLTTLNITLEKLDACDIPFLPPWLRYCTLNGNIDWSLPGIQQWR